MPDTPSKSNLLSSALKIWLAPAVLILAAQGAVLHVLSIPEEHLVIPQLSKIPSQLGKWSSVREQALEPDVQAYLRPDAYILRDYTGKAQAGTINLFVAYFKSLQSGYGPHSPSVCLPGNGWLVRQTDIVNVPVPGRETAIPVNKFVMEKGDQHILVLYWYQNDRNAWAQEFQGKLRLLPDLIRYQRSDVSLVRLVQALPSSDAGQELPQLEEFTKTIFPVLAENFRRAD